MTNRKTALTNYATVYAAFLDTITVGGDKNVALAYAVQDMNNQTKNLSEKDAAFYINDEANYLTEKMAKVAA